MERKELKEKCINMYLEGKTYVEIAKLTGWSRTYITNLIKNDKRIIDFKNNKKVKVYKRKNNNQMEIYIPSEYIEKLGISKDGLQDEYVDIELNEESKYIVIKKHS